MIKMDQVMQRGEEKRVVKKWEKGSGDRLREKNENGSEE